MDDKQLKVVEEMQSYGGGFVKALAECFIHADPINFAKLQNAFPEYWDLWKLCVECGQKFIWTGGEHAYMERLKAEGKIQELIEPKRCPACRAKRKPKHENH